ncbi:MAG: 1-phosphofructokinase family hexose kinase, partial [Vallitaleaceae bacterium]|nr:1-phosphofructokinase family hexose kinase [Vallitaleaceae bacterium]
MITTITLNPAIDRMIEVTEFEFGRVHRVQKVVKSLGGKSINVARILTGLDIKTQAVCFVGSRNLEEVKSFANQDQIRLVTIEVDGYTRTNVKLIEPDCDYRTTDLNEPGFFISKEKLDKMTELIVEQAQISDYVVLSGSLPAGIEANYYRELALKLAKITKVVIDADGVVLLEGMKGSPYLIKPNIHELESALSRELHNEQEIVKACEELIATYSIQYILVSMGEKGSILVGNQIALKADIIPV